MIRNSDESKNNLKLYISLGESFSPNDEGEAIRGPINEILMSMAISTGDTMTKRTIMIVDFIGIVATMAEEIITIIATFTTTFKGTKDEMIIDSDEEYNGRCILCEVRKMMTDVHLSHQDIKLKAATILDLNTQIDHLVRMLGMEKSTNTQEIIMKVRK